MERIVVWGAGNYCRLLLKNNLLKDYDIVQIADSDSGKWNMRIEGIRVGNPEKLAEISYDKVLIAVKNYEPIIEKLVYDLKINRDKIFFWNFDNNQICDIAAMTLSQQDNDSVCLERKLFKKLVCEIIEEDLLLECRRAGEFTDYRKIIVIGNEREYNAVKVFFEQEGHGRIVVMEASGSVTDKNGKYVLTSDSYRDDLERLLSKGVSKEQCVIIPLYDVKDTIIM